MADLACTRRAPGCTLTRTPTPTRPRGPTFTMASASGVDAHAKVDIDLTKESDFKEFLLHHCSADVLKALCVGVDP